MSKTGGRYTVDASSRSIGVAIIGCGAIGSYVAKALDSSLLDGLKLKILYDKDIEKARKLVDSLKHKPKIALDISEILEGDVELVVEAASQEAVREYGLPIIEAGKNLMIMSVGALADLELYERLREAASRRKVEVLIPSGAIAGLDAVKAAGIGGISSVTLTSRKPPRVFIDNPYVKSKGLNLTDLEEPLVLYEGPAVEACKLFPSSINVAATLSLASIGPEKVKVKIIADPRISGNVHEVVVEGEFGRLCCVTENKPTPENPKTSFLASLSALATLKKIAENVHIGT
ncbi:MAG: aspartate dehydrogenase [Candidatus Bathyarchaeia archaeon]